MHARIVTTKDRKYGDFARRENSPVPGVELFDNNDGEWARISPRLYIGKLMDFVLRSEHRFHADARTFCCQRCSSGNTSVGDANQDQRTTRGALSKR